MKHILLIWEEVPDRTQIFLFDLHEETEDFAKLMQCHGKYINTVEDEPPHPGWLSTFIEDLPVGACIYDTNNPGKPVSSLKNECVIIVTGIIC